MTPHPLESRMKKLQSTIYTGEQDLPLKANPVREYLDVKTRRTAAIYTTT
jgi:hypothetical protein